MNRLGSVLVIGSSGMLGSDLMSVLKNEIREFEIISPSSKELDITHKDSVFKVVESIQPTWIINCAGYTDVDRAEIERDKAYQLNTNGPEFLAKAALKTQSRLIHFSTDYVFSGEGEKPWDENDLTNPPQPNWYAQTKLLGEEKVSQLESHLILRVQWLYGHKRERFSALKTKSKFSPFKDQFGAPTWTYDISKIVVHLMKKKSSGLFHFSYDDFGSWFDVYDLVKKQWKLPVELKPQNVAEAHLPAKRPQNGRLSNEKLKRELGIKSIGSWKTSLLAFLSQVGCD